METKKEEWKMRPAYYNPYFQCCPICRSRRVMAYTQVGYDGKEMAMRENGIFHVKCLDCEHSTNKFHTLEEAEKAWGISEENKKGSVYGD